MKANIFHKRAFAYILEKDAMSMYAIAKRFNTGHQENYQGAIKDLINEKLVVEKEEDGSFTLPEDYMFLRDKDIKNMLGHGWNNVIDFLVSNERYKFNQWLEIFFKEIYKVSMDMKQTNRVIEQLKRRRF